MKIAIISDTHDNLVTLEKALLWCKKNSVTELIHCGDVCYPKTLLMMSKSFKGKIHLVFGNGDFEKDEMEVLKKKGKIKNIIFYNSFGEIIIDNQKIYFIHKPDKELFENLSHEKKYIFYGHTHMPDLKKLNNCLLVNPGNIAGISYRPSFAVWDTLSDSLSLKILDQLI